MEVGIFNSFNKNSKLFELIEKEKPLWWRNIISDKELYIELRKDNYINVYYFGGCVAKIWFDKDIKAETHYKYLKQTDTNKIYVDCISELESKGELDKIKKRIKEVYLKEESNLKEKEIQGKLILSSKKKYIDSEFAYNKDNKLRFDLVSLEN